MNTDTGELRRLEDQTKAIIDGFTRVPQRLEAEADAALGADDSTVVDLEADTGLARWARENRRRKREAVRERTTRFTAIPAAKTKAKNRKAAKSASRSRAMNRGSR